MDKENKRPMVEYYCPICDKYVDKNEISIVIAKEGFLVKGGRLISVDVKHGFCPYCNERLNTPDFDDEALLNAYEIYCKENGLLTRKDIIGLREYLELSTKEMAYLLNIDEADIKHYENGSIIDVSHDNDYRNLMRFCGYNVSDEYMCISAKVADTSIKHIKKSNNFYAKKYLFESGIITPSANELYNLPSDAKKDYINKGLYLEVFLKDSDSTISQYACNHILKKN